MTTILTFMKEINSQNKSETTPTNKTSNDNFRPTRLSLPEPKKTEKIKLPKKKLPKKKFLKRKSSKKVLLEEKIKYKITNIRRLTNSFREKLISILSK